jgi:hypothetical protein
MRGTVVTRSSLALQPDPQQTYVATVFAGRSSWPQASHGVRGADVTTYYEYRFDDQSFNEPGPGSFFNYSEFYRSGIFVR